METTQSEVVILGGGLSAGLLAFLLESLTDVSFVLVEAGCKLGGHKTWSMHEGDVASSVFELWSNLPWRYWSSHEVSFKSYTRRFQTGYRSLRSEDYHEALIKRIKRGKIRLSEEVVATQPPDRANQNEVFVVTAKQVYQAKLVIDARGRMPLMSCGYQKFVGLDIEFETPHGLRQPIIMDANVPQTDGFRFIYVLPFSDRHLLLEDTYYSDSSDLHDDLIEEAIRSYARNHIGPNYQVVRKEKGVLPIPLTDSYFNYSYPLRVMPFGVQAGLFHPTTGFSIGLAMQACNALTTSIKAESAQNWSNPDFASTEIKSLTKKIKEQSSFFLTLNRMLFGASRPPERIRIFERFNKLNPGLVQRFYAMDANLWDKIRIFSGRPPVAIHRALQVVLTDDWMTKFNINERLPAEK